MKPEGGRSPPWGIENDVIEARDMENSPQRGSHSSTNRGFFLERKPAAGARGEGRTIIMNRWLSV